MTDTDTPKNIAPPAPRSITRWSLPSVIDIEGDGADPRKTRLKDGETGEELTLGVHSLTFRAEAGVPNHVELVLADVAIRARVHHVHYEIPADDLYALAKMNGFKIEAVPAYPAQIRSYGPAEVQIFFRDIPDLVVTHGNVRAKEAIEAAEIELFDYLAELKNDHYPIPVASPVQDGEFLVYAHAMEPDFSEVDEV